jgi:proline dehydrogenase
VFDRVVVRILPAVPRSVVRRVAAPYIAGETLDDGRRVVAELNAAGVSATVDVLGEDVSRPEEAEAMARAYHDALEAIERESLDANVSIKLTGFGLELDRALCRSLVEALVDDAAARGIFVRIDMEDSSTTDDALGLYRALRASGRDNVGIVLQAALRRSLDDIASLTDLRPSVRLCKGIYLEPSSIAFQEPDVIRRSFVACLDALLGAGSRLGPRPERLRAADAARRPGRPRPGARRGRPSAPGLRALRTAVVRVLAPPPPGEPAGRGLRRAGHDRPRRPGPVAGARGGHGSVWTTTSATPGKAARIRSETEVAASWASASVVAPSSASVTSTTRP